jgi:crotonobetainyl-CoA:carnitine CoA-transferase CaiB-like acyl-CoA transferase
VNRGAFSEFTISSPTVLDNGFTAVVDHPLFGTHLRHGPVVTMSATPGTPGPACLVGQHTRAILAELGYSDEQVSDLHARSIVHCLDQD